MQTAVNLVHQQGLETKGVRLKEHLALDRTINTRLQLLKLLSHWVSGTVSVCHHTSLYGVTEWVRMLLTCNREARGSDLVWHSDRVPLGKSGNNYASPLLLPSRSLQFIVLLPESLVSDHSIRLLLEHDAVRTGRPQPGTERFSKTALNLYLGSTLKMEHYVAPKHT